MLNFKLSTFKLGNIFPDNPLNEDILLVSNKSSFRFFFPI